MRIIVIRHASTASNEAEIINGQRIDEDLSPKGRQQIPGLIESVAGYEFTVVYASPMKRALKTAQPIANHYNVALRKDARISEVDLGSFSGQPWDATIPTFGMNSSGVLSSCEYDFRPFGGESSAETRARVQSFLNDLKNQPDQAPLIVTHGGIMRWLHYICTGEKTGRIPNLTVYTFDI